VVSRLQLRRGRTNTSLTLFARALNRLRRQEQQPDPAVHLETCALCGADFVNPVDWEPANETHWWMLLRCGACDTWREATVTNAVAARFDFELDRRLDVMVRALERIDARRMAADVETMIEALRRGLVDAADFAR
jgi:flavoprotein